MLPVFASLRRGARGSGAGQGCPPFARLARLQGRRALKRKCRRRRPRARHARSLKGRQAWPRGGAHRRHVPSAGREIPPGCEAPALSRAARGVAADTSARADIGAASPTLGRRPAGALRHYVDRVDVGLRGLRPPARSWIPRNVEYPLKKGVRSPGSEDAKEIYRWQPAGDQRARTRTLRKWRSRRRARSS
jgi:hypothetical protein